MKITTKYSAMKCSAVKGFGGTRIAITGANGFIGSWLCRALADNGAEVIALVHGGIENIKTHGIEDKIRVYKADITNFEELKKAFAIAKPDICYHLAAISSTKIALQRPFETVDTNVIGTVKVLEAARQCGSAVCFASSVKVYGSKTKRGFREKDPLLGKSAYATSKICSEAECKMFSNAYGLNVGIARPGNVFGWADCNFERLIPGAIKSALLGQNPQVNGTGVSEFDFVFIKDVVSGLGAIGAKMLCEKMNAEAFNIGTGKSTSVKSVVLEIIRLSGKRVRIDFRGNEKPAKEKLSIAKTRKELGWKPKYTLKKGLQETVEWYKQNKHFFE